MDFDLTNLVKTTSDLDALNREIDILIDSLYRTGERSYEQVITKSIRKETAKVLETIGSKREERKENLEQLRQKLQQVKKITLTVAFEPTSRVVEEVVTWCRRNIADDVVVEFRHDQSILAGVVIEWNGKYMDVSLADKLERAINESV